MKIVIKVGSQSILSPTGEPLEPIMQTIIEQIICLQQAGHKVILVSSGAVALGRNYAKAVLNRNYANSVADKQLLASLGQPQLMAIYNKLCAKYNYLAAQLLLTKYDFRNKRSYINILRLLQKSLDQPHVISIINENDSVAVEELMFTDNDELSGIIASQIGADKLLLLTTTSGVYDKNPEHNDAKLLTEINLQDQLPEVSGKSGLGRGGMSSKLNTARKIANLGIMTHIANLAEPNIITRLVLEQEAIGTRIIPLSRQTARKKYLAFSQENIQAKIVVNQGLVNVLHQANQPISILPIGVEAFINEFRSGDLIEITSITGEELGVGIARYSSDKLNEYLGKHHCPELIHYDYLYLFPY
jgi:glutamate 5-kinase